MSGSLLTLLDDVAVLAKATAASLDDVAVLGAKAGAKSTAVVIDDIAITPSMVGNISPKRELPIIAKIALYSTINKLFIIIPAIMLLSVFLPIAIPILLLLGGAYLCYEGAEKVLEWLKLVKHHEDSSLEASLERISSKDREKKIVRSAAITDLVLSTEIMLISLANLETTSNWVSTLAALIMVAIVITAGIYGLVGLLIKVDDFGLHMFKNGKLSKGVRRLGFNISRNMFKVFNFLSVVGTVAMLWVGGHLLLKASYDLGFKPPYAFLETLTHFFSNGFLSWTVDTLGSGIFGVLFGSILVFASIGLVKLKSLLKKNEISDEKEVTV